MSKPDLVPPASPSSLDGQTERTSAVRYTDDLGEMDSAGNPIADILPRPDQPTDRHPAVEAAPGTTPSVLGSPRQVPNRERREAQGRL